MIKKIIPCLDTRNGKVVKGVKFKDIKELASPVDLARKYDLAGADEIVLYDISASIEERQIFTSLVRDVAAAISKPLIVGGGISTLQDADTIIASGAQKLSINSGAIKNPLIIKEIAEKYGSEATIVSVDVRMVNGIYCIHSHGGSKNTGINALEFAKKLEDLGAGAFVINSIDTDGVKGGYDLDMLAAFSAVLSSPIIASGGAGKKEDFLEVFNKVPGVSVGLAASVFHYGEIDICELKKYLEENGIAFAV